MSNKITTKTRAGAEVLIFTDKASGDRPILGAYLGPAGRWIPESWKKDGSWSWNKNNMDLML